ncbi:MAG: hypothetical protein EB002_12805, partial [Betaproteobacteria bacterium]|nr:hypothetical protein [Betaproteobacteria bacterium]
MSTRLNGFTGRKFEITELSGHPKENPMTAAPIVNYQTTPSEYKHIQLAFDGAVATLSINIDENAGIRPGYKL